MTHLYQVVCLLQSFPLFNMPCNRALPHTSILNTCLSASMPPQKRSLLFLLSSHPYSPSRWPTLVSLPMPMRCAQPLSRRNWLQRTKLSLDWRTTTLQVCVCVCVCMYARTLMHVCVWADVWVRMCMCVHVCVCVRTYVYVCMYVYACMHS